MNLSAIILLALGLGIGFGATVHAAFPTWVTPLNAYCLAPLGQAFLRLIQFVVVPIVFSSLIMGLTRVQNAAQVGRYTAKLLSGYVLTSAIAVGVGMMTAIILHPGVGVEGFALDQRAEPAIAPNLIDWLVSLIPVNPLAALSSGNLLQTILSGALIGVGIQQAGERAKPFLAFVESIYAISEKILFFILYLAPVGVFALISSVIAEQGLSILGRLITYMVSVVSAIALMTLLYGLLLGLVKGKPIHFFRSFFPSFSLGFGTASSNAALPVALSNAEDYGLSPTIASFAIPLGTALKRDGMALGQAINALFVAQLFNVPITASLLCAIALSTLLVSFSTAGVPGAGIVMLTTVLTAAGLPLEGVAILAGVDRLMDGFHTVLNLMGNVANAVILERWESGVTASSPTKMVQIDEPERSLSSEIL
ncbi:dicarboxylate/amino acid:cation symporter [Myxacorys almedinensis]|uniref:Cation:dicarboxylase symporter family transporter n=1 Tax=Myxacorys almedinensis A TaxID=2690445 RepID=A0A8J7Z8Y5_9CYAN|nr:dicarboxylate/amino acid:cation symporter [Myxacorys almedinensis]NDJ17625.1 cation:dicarboxylase symporter family transporter [Myxacorys almedinensis A]